MGVRDSLNYREPASLVSTSGTVQPDDLAALAAEGYALVVDLVPADSSYAVAGEADIVASHQLDYVHLPVDFAAPTNDDLDRFCEILDANRERRIHVHCAANYRVSAFYGLYAVSRGLWSVEEADAHLAGIWNPADFPPWADFIAEQRRRLAH